MASQSGRVPITRIDCARLINTNGTANCITDAAIIFGTNILFAGPRDEVPSEIAHDVLLRADTVMPGMWDCHVHLLGMVNAKVEDLFKIPLATRVARCIKCLELAISAGVTSVRELAGHGIDLEQAVREGSIVSPNIYSSGCVISPTGGHADVHCYPHDTVKQWEGTEAAVTHTCDGVPDCLKAVRLQLRRNAKVIKICCSGGVLSEVDHIAHQQFSEEEIANLTAEANRHRRAVAAHCHGKDGIVAFLKNSRAHSTVEHASFFDDECADLALKANALVVPTFLIQHRLRALGVAAMPAWAVEKLEAVVASHASSISLAHKRGVPIAMGTDSISIGDDTACPWGMHGQELKLMVDLAGLTPAEAIVAATTNGPRTLGPFLAPFSGVLSVGAVADIIAVQGNPLADIGVLGSRDNIEHVWKAGAWLKRDGKIVRNE